MIKNHSSIHCISSASKQMTHAWACTPTKKTIYDHIQQQWHEVTNYLASADDNIKVLFTNFEEREYLDANAVKWLVPKKEKVSAPYLVQFLLDLILSCH